MQFIQWHSTHNSVKERDPIYPRTNRITQYLGHAIIAWSPVCSAVQHSQFGEGARFHLCMDNWNRPTPVFKRLSLTQAARDKPIPTDLAPVMGTKHGAWKIFHSTPFYIYDMSPLKRECQVWQSCPKDSAHLAQMSVWILVSLGEHLRTHLKDHIRGLIKVQISTVSQG